MAFLPPRSGLSAKLMSAVDLESCKIPKLTPYTPTFSKINISKFSRKNSPTFTPDFENFPQELSWNHLICYTGPLSEHVGEKISW